MSDTNDIAFPPGGNTSPFDSIRRRTPEGCEFWSARDLQAVTEYARWEDFMKLVERAKASAANTGADVDQAFSVITEKGAGRPRVDVHLTRYAAYLTVMNGDPNMPRIAEAQAYFAIRTREAETAKPAFQIPRTMSEALRLAANEYDRAESEKAARIETERANRELAPAASAWDHLAQATGDYSVGDAAKILSRAPRITIGRDRLYAFMSAQGWVYRSPGGRRRPWRAYQAQVDLGRLTERIGPMYTDPDTGEDRLPEPTVRITVKGLAALHKLLGGDGPAASMAVVK